MIRILLTFLFYSLVSLSRGEVKYNKDVLPILADKCFSCHGADQVKRKANLRLDDKLVNLVDFSRLPEHEQEYIYRSCIEKRRFDTVEEVNNQLHIKHKGLLPKVTKDKNNNQL